MLCAKQHHLFAFTTQNHFYRFWITLMVPIAKKLESSGAFAETA